MTKHGDITVSGTNKESKKDPGAKFGKKVKIKVIATNKIDRKQGIPIQINEATVIIPEGKVCEIREAFVAVLEDAQAAGYESGIVTDESGTFETEEQVRYNVSRLG